VAEFMGRVEGSSGEAHRLGTAKSGITVMANAWDAGVRVVGEKLSTGGVAFTIMLTGGSNDQIPKRLIATVVDGVVDVNPAFVRSE
jgi:hypothetical protein